MEEPKVVSSPATGKDTELCIINCVSIYKTMQMVSIQTFTDNHKF